MFAASWPLQAEPQGWFSLHLSLGNAGSREEGWWGGRATPEGAPRSSTKCDTEVPSGPSVVGTGP